MYTIKAKVKITKTLDGWFQKTSQAAAMLYNSILDAQFALADEGKPMLTKFDVIQIFRGDGLCSDYKDMVADRAAKATRKWYKSEKTRLNIWLKHAKKRDEAMQEVASESGGQPLPLFRRLELDEEMLKEYAQHRRNLQRKQKIIGRPRRKKTISLEFAIRKERQSTVRLHEKIVEAAIPGKLVVRGRHSRLLPSSSEYVFKKGTLKKDACGDMWLCISVEGEHNRANIERKEDILVGVDCGLKTARTAVAVKEKTGEIVEVFQPERQKFYDKQLEALKLASNRDRRALPFVHRKIARRRHDTIEKEITKILGMGCAIKVGNPSAAWLFSGRLARSAADVANSRFVDRLAKRAEVAGKESGEVDESYTTVTCRMCGSRKKMSLRDREYQCSTCGHLEDRDVNSAWHIAFREFPNTG